MTEDAIDRAWAAGVTAPPVPSEILTKPPWRPFRDLARIWLNADQRPYPRRDPHMRGTFIAGRAIRYLEENRDRPFALWVSFQEPHSPFDFPIEDRSLFHPGQFPPPPVGPEDAPQIPNVFRDLGDGDKRGIAAAYYTSAAFLDRNVGRVLDALRRLELDRDTFAVYMADHGYCLGHHGRFEKHCGYDPALRVPLIVRWPGRVRRGVVRDLTEHVDVPATILDMLDLPPLPAMHGRSLRPYLEGRPMPQPRDHIFSEYLENEEAYIRTPEWKFIFCSGARARRDGYETNDPTPGPYHRLFDLRSDPGEFHNVAPHRNDLVTKFESLMLDRFRATHPAHEPAGLNHEAALSFYLAPRDAPVHA
jgi:choline-sulfatase